MENTLQAETDKKKKTVLKIIGFTYCYFPPVIDDETDELDYKEYNDRVYIDGVITFDKMREIIKYLEEKSENPMQEGLEEDLEKEIKDTCRGYRINDYHEQELGKQDIENIARHFAQWGAEHARE